MHISKRIWMAIDRPPRQSLPNDSVRPDEMRIRGRSNVRKDDPLTAPRDRETVRIGCFTTDIGRQDTRIQGAKISKETEVAEGWVFAQRKYIEEAPTRIAEKVELSIHQLFILFFYDPASFFTFLFLSI